MSSPPSPRRRVSDRARSNDTLRWVPGGALAIECLSPRVVRFRERGGAEDARRSTRAT
jgi:hypothetical protein